MRLLRSIKAFSNNPKNDLLFFGNEFKKKVDFIRILLFDHDS